MAAASSSTAKAAQVAAAGARLVITALYRWGAATAIVGTVAWMLLLVHRKVYDHLLTEERYKLDPRSLAVIARPQWAGSGIDFSVGANFPYAGRVSIFEKDLVAHLAGYYGQNPWVARVVRIRKELPNRLRVQLEIRKPVAAVEQKGSYYLVDRDAVRLPGKYPRRPDLAYDVPVLIGVPTVPPAPGQAWRDAAVDAGVAVAQTLLDYELMKSMKLIAIDVENVGGRKSARESEVVLWAEEMVPIQWGRATVTEKFGEVPVELKMKNLQLVQLACPRLRGLATVKVQFHRPYVVAKER
ncbi:MAG: hypothetical protein HZA54_13055 [Planctomycetes bacterium]|nr:hypothetical protein [Planctomycetota bacterium]